MTLQFAGLALANQSNIGAVPLLAWSSPVITTTALWRFGKYQKRGSGFLSRFARLISLTNSRCCSSACGMAILSKST